jgi:hypothetical protein
MIPSTKMLRRKSDQIGLDLFCLEFSFTVPINLEKLLETLWIGISKYWINLLLVILVISPSYYRHFQESTLNNILHVLPRFEAISLSFLPTFPIQWLVRRRLLIVE